MTEQIEAGTSVQKLHITQADRDAVPVWEEAFEEWALQPGKPDVGNEAAAQVIAKALAAHRIAALEEAAGVAVKCKHIREYDTGTADHIAAAIRALKGPQ